MFETLDILISFGVIFLILSMILKYVMSLTKRVLKIKATVVAEELKAFIGENTSRYLIPYLDKKARHLNFLVKIKKGENGIRQLDNKQLEEIVDKLSDFLKDKSVQEINEDLGIELSYTQEKLNEIKTHLGTLKKRIEYMYENTIQKISEAYETRLKTITLICGILLSVLINADFFDIYGSLSKNSLIRGKIVAQTEAVKNRMDFITKQIELNEGKEIKNLSALEEDVNENIKKLTDELNKAELSLGWTSEKLKESFGDAGSFIRKVFGLIASGLLISFGAPFWHEFLSSFSGIKNKLRGK